MWSDLLQRCWYLNEICFLSSLLRPLISFQSDMKRYLPRPIYDRQVQLGKNLFFFLYTVCCWKLLKKTLDMGASTLTESECRFSSGTCYQETHRGLHLQFCCSSESTKRDKVSLPLSNRNLSMAESLLQELLI